MIEEIKRKSSKKPEKEENKVEFMGEEE